MTNQTNVPRSENHKQSLRILFISPYLPSLIRVRPFNFIKHLAQRGHNITLLALQPPGEDTSGLEALHQWCQRVEIVPLPRWRTLWNGLQAVPGRTPFQAAYSRSPEMAARIRAVQAETHFDVVHIEHLRGAELRDGLNGVPVVFDSVDSISLLFEHVRNSGPTWRSRLMANLDLGRTRHYEGRLAEQFERVLVTSPKDKEALVRLANGRDAQDQIAVLPNGVDLAYFSPMDLERDPATIVFSGKMSYHANIAAALDLATKIMPRIWEGHPGARLMLVGKDPSPAITALSADPRIVVTGTVPDLRPYLAQATVAVLPIRYGVGIQNKVLEAMAMATPVVTTPQTLTALQARVSKDVLIADSPEAISQATITLLTDPEQCQQLGLAGRRYVETYHDWNVVAGHLEAVYNASR